MTIKDIEKTVTKLPRKKLAAFRAWFYRFDGRVWDKQFKEDVKMGKLDGLSNKAIEDFKKDKCQSL